MSDDDFGVDMAQVLKLSKALKEFEPALRKELHKGMRDAAKPLIPVLREELLAEFPTRGGLAAKVAKAPARVAVKTGGGAVTIQIVFKGITVKLGEVYGYFRHPVYADKTKSRSEWTWRSQELSSKGRLEFATKRSVRLVVPKIQETVQAVADKVVNGHG